MRVLRKVIYSLLVYCLPMILLNGCVNVDDVKEKQDEKKPVEIVLWDWDNTNNVKMEMVNKFNESHSDIKVKYKLVDWNNYYNKLITAVSADSAPDAAVIVANWRPVFTGMDALVQLDDYIAKWDGKDQIYDSIWTAIQGKPNDPIYGMPTSNTVYFLFCRKDIFEKAGAKIPTTLDEFYEAARKTTMDTDGDGKTDIYGFGMRGARAGHYMWSGFVMSEIGGEIVDAEGNPRFNTPETVAANQRYIDLYKNGYTPPTAPKDGWPEIMVNMEAGITAMTVSHVGTEHGVVEKFRDNIVAVPMPEGKKGRWAFMGTTALVMFESSKNKDEIFKFFSEWCSPEYNDILSKKFGQVPVNKVIAQDSYYQQNMFHKVSLDSLEFGHVFSAIENTANFTENVWPDAMQRALLGEITSQEMMDILEKAMKVKK